MLLVTVAGAALESDGWGGASGSVDFDEEAGGNFELNVARLFCLLA